MDPDRSRSEGRARAAAIPRRTCPRERPRIDAARDGDACVSRAAVRAPFPRMSSSRELTATDSHTVSIVEGEVASTGMYPQHTAKLEAFARRIFALPNVEVASHTYSHPFEWEDAEAGKREPHVPHLAIKGYTFDLEREIKGSIDYINSLAPRDKRVKVLLWTGMLAQRARGRLTQRLGLFNSTGRLDATRATSVAHARLGEGSQEPGSIRVCTGTERERINDDWLGPSWVRHA